LFVVQLLSPDVTQTHNFYPVHYVTLLGTSYLVSLLFYLLYTVRPVSYGGIHFLRPAERDSGKKALTQLHRKDICHL